MLFINYFLIIIIINLADLTLSNRVYVWYKFYFIAMCINATLQKTTLLFNSIIQTKPGWK